MKAQRRLGLALSWPRITSDFPIDVAVLALASRLPGTRQTVAWWYGVAVAAVVTIVTYREVTVASALARWVRDCRGGGGSAVGSGRVEMRSALAGFVVWVRPLQNLFGGARRSSHGPPDRTRRSRGAGRRTIPDDSRGISAVNQFVLMV